jgi:lipopolysaccharide export LptBFGC system permease protein LptF
MRSASIALLLAGAACEVFAYWGLNTARGRRAFDEMAGMLPLAAAPAGVVLILLAAVLWWRSWAKRG